MEGAAGMPEKAAPVPSAAPGLPLLAESLRTVGYSGPALRAVLGVSGDLPIGAADLAVYERRLAAFEMPLGDVIALLTLGWPRPTANSGRPWSSATQRATFPVPRPKRCASRPGSP